jgi:hypothetical protein
LGGKASVTVLKATRRWPLVTTHVQSDDFDIAKTIFDQLKDLPAERQQRVLRWIAEGLGVSSVAPSLGTNVGGGGPPSPAAIQPAAGMTVGPTDIKSFIAAKSPKSDQQFAAAVAYFYRFEAPPAERRDSINGDVLQEAARLAGRKRLANPRVTLNNAKGAGYLDGASPGEFTINSVGENLVAMTLPGGAETSTRKPKAARAKSKSKTAKKKR